MKRLAVLLTAVCLLLSGCGSWMDGSYHSAAPHQEKSGTVLSQTISASNYQQLREVMVKLVDNGTENALIYVPDYDQAQLEKGLSAAVEFICGKYPLGAYAVEKINCEVGTSGGQPAVSVNIAYIHGRSEIRAISRYDDISQASAQITSVLDQCGEGIALWITDYQETDIGQMVADYARNNPNLVMETPQVVVGVYPETGSSRILEIKFAYQNSRDDLRQMQTQVQRVFTSALLYLNSGATDSQKYSQLYTFLMERFDYQQETSITPAYSLLNYGVGDSSAFAVVYAAMCRQAGLECQVITGTKAGSAWCWNLILENGNYYHVDLLQSSQNGGFTKMTEADMNGYVWDYSAYAGE